MTDHSLPDSWTARGQDQIPQNATCVFGGEHDQEPFFVDLIDLGNDAYHLRAGAFATADGQPERASDVESIGRVHTFTDTTEGIDATKRLMELVELNVSEAIEQPLAKATETISEEFAARNPDDQIGHPAEDALQGMPISTGPAPAIFSADANTMLADALTGTPRVTVYVQGTPQHGYSPVLWFDGTTKTIEDLSAVYEEFPQFEDRFACDELVVSALARRVRRDTTTDDGRRVSDLVLDEVAVIDQD